MCNIHAKYHSNGQMANFETNFILTLNVNNTFLFQPADSIRRKIHRTNQINDICSKPFWCWITNNRHILSMVHICLCILSATHWINWHQKYLQRSGLKCCKIKHPEYFSHKQWLWHSAHYSASDNGKSFGCTRIIFQSCFVCSMMFGMHFQCFAIAFAELSRKQFASKSKQSKSASNDHTKNGCTSKQPNMEIIKENPFLLAIALDKNIFSFVFTFHMMYTRFSLFEQWLCKLCRLLCCCQHFLYQQFNHYYVLCVEGFDGGSKGKSNNNDNENVVLCLCTEWDSSRYTFFVIIVPIAWIFYKAANITEKTVFFRNCIEFSITQKKMKWCNFGKRKGKG